jgi:hypothetical protein
MVFSVTRRGVLPLGAATTYRAQPLVLATLSSACQTYSMRSSETPFPRPTERLLRDHLPGTAKLSRKILQLWQTVSHWQYGFGIIDVNAGLEFKRRNG